jgi:hypothetical protein
MTSRFVVIYGLDLVILLLAIGAALAAHGERHRWPVPRGRLLLPGVLAIFGTAILLTYPDIRDATAPELWVISAAGLAIGGVRGGLMAIDATPSGLVSLHHGADGAWVGWAMALCAGIQGSIETGLSTGNLYEATAELLMLLCSGFLLGRSLVVWLRACLLPRLAVKQ